MADTYTTEEGARILAEVAQHPKRELIKAIAEATYDLANEHEPTGGGMWFHLDQAHALVEALPALVLVRDVCPECKIDLNDSIDGHGEGCSRQFEGDTSE